MYVVFSSQISVNRRFGTQQVEPEKDRRNPRREWFRWLAGVILALLSGQILVWVGVGAQIDAQFAQLGFDADRIFLLTSLLLVLLSSLGAGMLVQRGGAAWLGGLLLFVVHYLLPFVQQALHPGLSPADQAQKLVPDVFIEVILTDLALSVLCAGAGAAIGKACRQILLVPLLALGQRLLAKVRRSSLPQAVPSLLIASALLAAGVLVVSSVIITALGAGPLLNYGPTTNLYQPVQNKHLSAGNAALPSTGTLQSGTFRSPALGGLTRTYWIYLPPSYSVLSSRRYPTFYLLHGSPGEPKDWFQAAHAATTADALIAAGKMRETILIGVDGNGPVYRFSEWANSFNKRQRMEDSLVQDLVPFIDQHYRTLAEASQRALGGLSMGGYGAVNIALHHPEVFHGVMSVGGYFQATGPVFGSGSTSAAYRRLNSPSLVLQTPAGKENAARLEFVIGVGTTDGHYYSDGMAFYKQLHALLLNVHLLVAVGGHSWTVWAQQLGESLPLLEPAQPVARVALLKNTTTLAPLLNSFSLFDGRSADEDGRNTLEEVQACLH